MNKESMLQNTPIPNLLLKLSVPAILNMLIVSVYSLTDAWFISGLGNGAGGAVGISFTISCAAQAVGFTVGSGGASLLSRALGSKEIKKAGKIVSVSFWISLAAGSVLGLAGLVFQNHLIRFLGADDEIFNCSVSYFRYLFLSFPVLTTTFVLNSLLRSEGKVFLASVGFFIGNLLNIALDPLLMFTFHMGISGASFATLVSQGASFLFLLWIYIGGKSSLSLTVRNLKGSFQFLMPILKTGFPSLLRQGLGGLASVTTARLAFPFGTAAIAGLSAVSRVFLFLYGFCLGIGQGMMPASGFNYGAKRFDRVRRLYQFSVCSATLILLFLALSTFFFSNQLIYLIRRDQYAAKVGGTALKALCLALPLHGLISITNMQLQALGKNVGSSLLAASRQGLFFLPTVFILTKKFGLPGLCVSQAVADGLTFCLSIPFAVRLWQGEPTHPKES